MRTIPRFGEERIGELEAAWKGRHGERERKKLQVVRLAAGHKLKAAEIAEAAGVCRCCVFRYVKLFREGGVEALLEVNYEGRERGSVDAATEEEFKEELGKGRFTRAKDAQRWLSGRGITLALSSVYYWLGKAGGVLKVPRKTHARKDAAKAEEFKASLCERLGGLTGRWDRLYERVRLWAGDEHRYGLLPVVRRCWGLKGVRVYAPYQTRYEWGYLYEAVELDGGCGGEFLFAPTVRKDVANGFLGQIGQSDPDALHVVIWDGAGFHARNGEQGVPHNVRLLQLPPYSPELNPVEGLGDMVKDAVANKLYPSLRSLEDSIWEEVSSIRDRAKGFSSMIPEWMRLQVNSSDKILKYVYSS